MSQTWYEAGESEGNIDPDVIFYMQRPYVRLIQNVYLDSIDHRHLQSFDVERWWPGVYSHLHIQACCTCIYRRARIY